MKRYARNTGLSGLVIGLLLAAFSGTASASEVCGSGLGQPPFLSFGVDSNLLLLLDNSGSMLDLAYIDVAEQCYDDTYDNTTTATSKIYSGYFDRTRWYVYDFAAGTFKVQAAEPAMCGTALYFSLNDSGGKFVCVDGVIDASTNPDSITVTEFAATGNFLNWATATKFDIQKEILTGGKYDSVNQNLQMESRGCLDHRFVKQVALAQGTYKLALGVRGPMEVYETWLRNTAYVVDDIVIYNNTLYKATAAHTSGEDFDPTKWDVYKDTRWYPNHAYPANTAVYDVVADDWCWTQEGGTSDGDPATGCANDEGIVWEHYDGTSIEIFNIVEGGFAADACQEVLDLIGSLTGDPSHDGATDNPNTPLGKIKLLTQECMGFAPGGGNNIEQARKVSFNHAMQECWYFNKFGEWQPGGGTVNSMKTACENVYDYMNPQDITPWDSSYVCAGSYQPEDNKAPYDYVGRCWEVAGIPDCTSNIPCGAHGEDEIWSIGEDDYTCDDGITYVCNKHSCVKDRDAKPADWTMYQECTSSGGGNLDQEWTDDNFYFFNPCPYKTCGDNNDLIDDCPRQSDLYICASHPDWTCSEDPGDGNLVADYCYTPDPVGDLCVEQAIKDFCGILSVPEVIDPSDSTNLTDEVWNAPAYLIDSGMIGQLGMPRVTLKGYIKQVDGPDDDPDVDVPQGVLHSTADKLRIGAMAFNEFGGMTECDSDDPTDAIDRYCPDNRDGAQVITRIMLGNRVTGDNDTPDDDSDDPTHVDDLVDSINDIRATSWTPLAEAMYNAIGYYTQNPEVRLAETDFQIDADVLDGWQADHDYAPDSYILVDDHLYHTKDGGKSGSVSLADDVAEPNPRMDWTEVDTYDPNGWLAGTNYPDNTIVLHDDTPDDLVDNRKFYITYSGGISAPKASTGGGPLYDKNVIWEPFIDPVANWCQENHVLVITEGASTADVSPRIINFAEGDTTETNPDPEDPDFGEPYNTFNTVPIVDPLVPGDADTLEPDYDLVANQCTDGLVGSTYLDDLAYFAWNYLDPDDREGGSVFTLYPTGNATIPSGDLPYTGMPKQSIKTHFVVNGALRDDGTDSECNPAQLMESAAYNGGTSAPVPSENPEELEENLLAIFNALAQRASAGSAASVISSARGGEGAIYQAIFWPELKRDDGGGRDITVAWAGDVHGLFLDNRGYMYEDTNGDRKLTPYEDLDGDGNFDVEEDRGEDIDGDGHYDCEDEDKDLDGNLDVNEDLNGNGVWEPELGEDVDGDEHYDMVNEDLDGDGYLDTGEDVNHNNELDDGENLNGINPLTGTETLERTENLDGETCDLADFDPFVDVDGDGHQDVNEDLNGDGTFDDDLNLDHRVVIYFDDDRDRSMACYNTSIFSTGTCTTAANGTGVKELDQVAFLWSANEWLSGIPDALLNANRPQYLSGDKQRYMFTWNDLDNDGIVDIADNEILPLEATANWGGLAVDASRGPVVNDFDVSSEAELDLIVNWLRGEDWLTDENDPNGNGLLDPGEPTDSNGNGIIDEPLRSRRIPLVDGTSAPTITWRLGDIIHSTPMTVAAPAEGYHLIYNDYSYAQFLTKYKGRRHVVYFGGNDGFLHAVNAGFYSESEKRFCLYENDSDGHCTEACPVAIVDGECPDSAVWPESYADAPALGTELWAYLPYNLQPHVKCLADPEYNHKYFVDLRPRIFDAQIFPEEGECRDGEGNSDFGAAGCKHPNGWGTILVGGLRFGGTPIKAEELTGHVVGDDSRMFISSYFILDITDPENPPVLLGELSSTTDGTTVDLGYSAMISTMVIMKEDNPSTNRWYLILGSGPRDTYGALSEEAIKGISDDSAKLAVLPLEWLTGIESGGGKTGLRIPDDEPAAGEANAGGRWDLADHLPTSLSSTGFVSDAITVDFDINPSYTDYKADAVYFGTVEGDFATNASGTYWNGGGLMCRLVTKNIDGGGVSPIGRYTTEGVTIPFDWKIKPLIDLRGVNQPVTAAASVGTDGYNFWIYFGTGRFFDPDDKTDDLQQSYYGIKEPMIKSLYNPDGIVGNADDRNIFALTWAEMAVRTTTDPPASTIPGFKGLWDVSDILVAESPTIKTAALSCRGGTLCLPALQDNTLYYLDKYIAGDGGSCGDTPRENCVDGWYKDFHPYFNREKNVGQATLLGGLVTFTTYQPYNDVCQAEGNAYLYGVYYRTGTAWHENVFGCNGVNGDNVSEKLDLGRGLATTPNLHVGSGTGDDDQGPKAFVQTSTGEIREIEQENLPIKNYRTGRSMWKEYTN